MVNLSAFLAQNALPVENERFAASRRFVDEDGRPMEWEIRSISSDEDEALRKSCTKRMAVPGKRGMYTPETDYNLYLGRLAAKCTVFPNLDDAELQNSYGVMGADLLLKTMLTPGEYADYLSRVQEVNGFDQTFDEAVDEAKN
ncbi:phage tail assembly chaperone [Anaerolentibacter hominis]|uniref:phage tail assembly chaperone n=1 Tax=Anaerolentibacter hominis TaxID=3079009 RepID=UPI0031B7FF45